MISDSFTCVFQDIVSKKRIGSARWKQGLFVLDDFPSSLSSPISPLSPITLVYACTNGASNSIPHGNFDSNEVFKLLWHYKLGHPTSSRLQILNHVYSNIDVDNRCHCSICPLAKQHKLSFPVHVASCLACFDLINVDIWGPSKVLTINSHKYFLTVVDNTVNMFGCLF